MFNPSPTSPTRGQTDSSNAIASTAYVKAAVAAGGPGGPSTILISTTPPIAPVVGNLWWESDTGVLYVRYDDVDTSQWVAVNVPMGLPDAPSDSNLYGRRNASWTVVSAAAPSTSNPLMDGTAAPGASSFFSRGDHIHPSDTSRASVTYVDAQVATKASTTYVDAQVATKVAKAGDTMTGSLAVNGNVFSGAAGATGTYFFGSSGTKQLNYDGSAFNLVGGPLSVNGPHIMSAPTATTGVYHFGTSGGCYLYYDGGNFNLVGGTLFVNSIVSGVPTSSMSLTLQNTTSGYTKYMRVSAAGALEFINNANTVVIAGLFDNGDLTLAGGAINLGGAQILSSSGNYHLLLAKTGSGRIVVGNATEPTSYYQNTSHLFYNAAGTVNYTTTTSLGLTLNSGGIQTRGSTVGSLTGNYFNIGWVSSLPRLWIDTTDAGQIVLSSDYRIKKDVLDLPGMWDTVKALRPIKYTQAQFSPPSHLAHIAKQKADKAEKIPGDLFEADDIERWGFIAHELQETLTPSASTGEKDSPNTIQSPNPFTLIAALTKALQEAMSRIEALEAR